MTGCVVCARRNDMPRMRIDKNSGYLLLRLRHRFISNNFQDGSATEAAHSCPTKRYKPRSI